MLSIDSWFVEIARFSLIAFVLLIACVSVVRLLRQPLERLRLIQISLATLLLAMVIGIAGVLPTIDLAWLPPDTPREQPRISDAASIEPQQHSSSLADTPLIDARHPREATAPSNYEFSPTPITNEPSAASANPPAKAATLAQIARRTVTIAFLLGSLISLLHLGIGWVISRRLIHGAKSLKGTHQDRVQEIITRFPTRSHVQVLVSDSIDVPMVVGFWRPRVLIPDSLVRDDANRLDLQHSLAHEWGHVVLNDVATWQLTSFLQTLLWIQPGYWMLRRELRVAQDQLADQFATQLTQQHATYASTLLELSRSRQRVLPGALTMAGGKSNLYRRIEMLMNEKFQLIRVSRKSVLMCFTLFFVLTSALMASLQLTRAASPDQSEQPVSSKTSTPNEKAADMQPAEHSGVVIDANTGEPIEGVTVTVTRMESRNWQELAVTKSTTDANGKYTFTIPPTQLKERLLYIMFDIEHPEYAQRHCGSYGYGMIVRNLENGEQPWFSEFKMVRGEKVAGRLVDENGQPIPNVRIRFRSQPTTGYDRVRSSSVDGMSDDNGRFEMLATHDGQAKISFIPPEHCMKHIDVGTRRGDIGDITLEPGFPLHGVVKDAKGTPMGGLWVNITPEEERRESSYEMKRSAKTDAEGKFTSRPLKAGKYLIEVETKATGAIEKLKYANFRDTPASAMFVNRSIQVTEASARQPLIIQAVPHVLITAKFYKPDGRESGGHSPSVMGMFDGQRMWIREGKRSGEGTYELMVPHGFEDAELRFTTNEHSGLEIQFEGEEPTPQDTFKYERIESDIDNIRVIRHPAGILKMNIVDESGQQIKDAGIFANYKLAEEMDDQMMMRAQIGWNREEGMFRLSSLVPGATVAVRFDADGFESQTKEFVMKEGERRTVDIKLSKSE